MADETLLDKGALNIPTNLDDLKLYGVNTEQNPNTDGQVNASLLAQALGGQTGNVANTNYGDLPSVAFTPNDDPQPLYDALNALPLQLVPHGKTYTFSTVRITATSATSFIADKRFYRFRTALTNGADAQGAYYGVGSGITLNASNMKFRRFEQQIITVENGVVTGTSAYDLGDIGTSSVADVVNGSTNTYTESNGVILLTATDGTTQEYYIYNGSESVIGNGGNAVTDDDFTTVDPATSVPAANDVYVMGGQLQNLVIEGVQNEVTSVELLATVFKTEEDGVIEGDNIPKYFANFEVISTGVRATLLRRLKLNGQFKPNFLCVNATKLDDVQGFVTEFGIQEFRSNTIIQEIILPSVKGSTQNVIQGNTALTKLVVPSVDIISAAACTSLTHLDARNARIVGELSGSPLTEYLNIDSAEDLAFNNNFNNCQRTEINLNTLIRINSQNITQNSLIEVFRTPLLESMSGGTFRFDTKIKELRLPNLREVNPEGVTAHTFAMEAIELIEAPKCKVFGSDTVVNQIFLDTDLSNCKIVVNEHLKTSNNGGINANIQDAIDKGATVVFVKDYAEEIEGGLTQANLLQSLTSTSTTDGVAANKITELADQVVIMQQILFSNDATLDELQEVVDFIKQNKTDLETLGISNIAGLTDALANVNATQFDGKNIDNFWVTDNNSLSSDLEGSGISLDNITKTGSYRSTESDCAAIGLPQSQVFHIQHPTSSLRAYQYLMPYSGATEVYFRRRNSVWTSVQKLTYSGYTGSFTADGNTITVENGLIQTVV